MTPEEISNVAAKLSEAMLAREKADIGLEAMVADKFPDPGIQLGMIALANTLFQMGFLSGVRCGIEISKEIGRMSKQ
jgi:hypothetical protein